VFFEHFSISNINIICFDATKILWYCNLSILKTQLLYNEFALEYFLSLLVSIEVENSFFLNQRKKCYEIAPNWV